MMYSRGRLQAFRIVRSAHITSIIRSQHTKTTSTNTPAYEQLSRLRELIGRVGGTNKPGEKQGILAEYPDLRELLEHLYDPHEKHHITSAKLLRANLSDTPNVPCPPTLSELLETLSNRQVTGTEAVNTVIAFLQANNIESSNDEDGNGLTLKEVFLRVLDKNLKAGVAGKTLKAVDWEAEARRTEEDGRLGKGANEDEAGERTAASDNRPMVSTSPTTTQAHHQPSTSLLPPTRLPHFSCALGKTILRKDLDRVLSLPSTASASPTSARHPKWLASRKLDGVRLLVVVDVRVPDAADGVGPKGVQVGDIWTLSRSGREYFSLDVLKRQIRETLSGWLELLDILSHEPRYPNSNGQGLIQRLVLDGELCHLMDDPTTAHPAEDFTQVVSMVRRKDYTIQRPTMFLLDVVPWSVFVDGMGKGGDGSAEEYKVFADRAKDCAAVVERVERRSLELGAEPVLRRLQQRAVGSIQEVEDMIGVAADRGWEGLVIRRGDMPYEGKRSSHILKYKEWQDGEYVAVGVDVTTMRLPVDGVYAERKALANVWIEHKGTKVSVGSGFTAHERLRYAEDPSLIIGKEMTVEYFAESTSLTREGSAVSLRFPRIKKVWEQGKRDV